jgi:hypothetical protein
MNFNFVKPPLLTEVITAKFTTEEYNKIINLAHRYKVKKAHIVHEIVRVGLEEIYEKD